MSAMVSLTTSVVPCPTPDAAAIGRLPPLEPFDDYPILDEAETSWETMQAVEAALDAPISIVVEDGAEAPDPADHLLMERTGLSPPSPRVRRRAMRHAAAAARAGRSRHNAVLPTVSEEGEEAAQEEEAEEQRQRLRQKQRTCSAPAAPLSCRSSWGWRPATGAGAPAIVGKTLALGRSAALVAGALRLGRAKPEGLARTSARSMSSGGRARKSSRVAWEL